MNTRYTLVQDDGGDWYIIPVDLFQSWIDFYGSDDYMMGFYPEWAEYVQDPSSISFTEWRLFKPS